MSQQLFYNLLTALVIVIALFAMRKLQKPGKGPEGEPIIAVVQTKQTIAILPVQDVSKSEYIQDEELLAVITVGIHAFIGSADFKVIHIKRQSNKWQLAGRQNLMNSRM